jgi:hypothetical protein
MALENIWGNKMKKVKKMAFGGLSSMPQRPMGRMQRPVGGMGGAQPPAAGLGGMGAMGGAQPPAAGLGGMGGGMQTPTSMPPPPAQAPQVTSPSTSSMKKGGKVKTKTKTKTEPVKKMASGGKASSASSRADGCCVKGKTRGKMM